MCGAMRDDRFLSVFVIACLAGADEQLARLKEAAAPLQVIPTW